MLGALGKSKLYVLKIGILFFVNCFNNSVSLSIPVSIGLDIATLIFLLRFSRAMNAEIKLFPTPVSVPVIKRVLYSLNEKSVILSSAS